VFDVALMRGMCVRVAAVLLCAAMLSASMSAQNPPALQRFSVTADGHPLTVWARIPAQPKGAVLLLHGRTWSARPDFDLQVPGLQRSVLASLELKGFAAYALDQRGYGATPRDSTGFLTPKRAAADAAIVLAWIRSRHAALPRPALIGWSLGAATAHLAAVTSASSMSSVVLFGYAPDPDAELPPDVETGPPLRAKTSPEGAASDFISPKVTPPIVVKTFVDTALKTDPIATDWRHEDQFVYDSARISIPTLVLFGERDPNVDRAGAEQFFSRLNTKERRLVEIPGADHCAHLEDTHDAWINEVANFIGKYK
jgi:alpha-beta hydrolase superfamily lysophospholipase